MIVIQRPGYRTWQLEDASLLRDPSGRRRDLDVYLSERAAAGDTRVKELVNVGPFGPDAEGVWRPLVPPVPFIEWNMDGNGTFHPMVHGPCVHAPQEIPAEAAEKLHQILDEANAEPEGWIITTVTANTTPPPSDPVDAFPPDELRRSLLPLGLQAPLEVEEFPNVAPQESPLEMEQTPISQPEADPLMIELPNVAAELARDPEKIAENVAKLTQKPPKKRGRR